MDKQAQLKQLKAEMDADKNLPLRSQATQLVFGEGDPDAELYFLGEAPGYFEDQKGRPFVGQAGQLLDRTLESIGIKREEVYISNVVRFRPPGNRDPLPEELAAFAPYIDREIEIIKPKIIVTLGRFSMGKFIPDVKISRVHGQVFQVDGKFIYSLGRAKLYQTSGKFSAGKYEVEVDPSPILTPDDFLNEDGSPMVEELHPQLRRVVYACGGVMKKQLGQLVLALYVNVGDRQTVEVRFPWKDLISGWWSY